MSKSINRVTLLGNVGKDAETKFTPSGIAKTTFSLATSRSWKKGDNWEEETTWHNVVLWRSENVANHLLKGKQVYVDGRIETRSYEARDGQKKYITEIVADNVILCGGSTGAKSARGNDWNDTDGVTKPGASSKSTEAGGTADFDDVPLGPLDLPCL